MALLKRMLTPKDGDDVLLTLEQCEQMAESLAQLQRDINWWIGDLARYAEHRWPNTHHQIWPAGVSVGLLQRCVAVAKAYPNASDREHEATWSQYRSLANADDREQRLAEAVGQTSDETRDARRDQRRDASRWLAVFDGNYFVHRYFHSGAGVETGMQVSEWIQRTCSRLAEKGLTDCVVAFDSPDNHRKQLTAEWDHKYKDRGKKDPELIKQLAVCRELLEQAGTLCVSVDTMEADDVMASYAHQYPGRVTLVSDDKDMRQCLCVSVNILRDIEWTEDATSGQMLPTYCWISAKSHTEETGIRPELWTEYQALMGDTADGIKGAPGIGKKGAADLIEKYGSSAAAIAAAKARPDDFRDKARNALLEFEPFRETTLQLVTLRTDLDVPQPSGIPNGETEKANESQRASERPVA